jgi:serine-type D-Ala-D-Ala carboxypeptidase (penicillin-binding protein 5/6)
MLLNSHKVVASLNPRAPVEIASLTKIMTCLIVLETAKRMGVDIKIEEVTIGQFEQNIGGTSARISRGEVYTVEQLLFGLMLPSGNDASLALAVWAGRKFLEY